MSHTTQPVQLSSLNTFTERKENPRPPPPINNKLEETLVTYSTVAQGMLYNNFALRDSLAYVDRAYMREMDYTLEQNRARLANNSGDPTKFQNVQVPVVMPQVRAALGYLTNVFLTGYPIFGVVADKNNADAAMQMETIFAENSRTAQWQRHLLMFFLDGLKYNLHALEVIWGKKTVSGVDTDVAAKAGTRPKETIWNGNEVRRLDLYNSFWDTRVLPAELSAKGEYAGYSELLSRTALKQYLNDLFGYINPTTVDRALASTFGGGAAATGWTPFAYYQPLINPMPFINNNVLQFDWMAWATAARQPGGVMPNYGNFYIKTVQYCRIVPADFNMEVPGRNTPQIWKLVIINGSVVVQWERVQTANNYLPILMGQPLEDGLGMQTKSFATNVIPMQQVASAMINGFVASKRRLIGDRMLYDPLRVRESDINSDSPTAKIPVRPAAYGKPLNEAVFPIPFRDEQTASFLQGSELVMRYANMINQQNPAQQGQFVKGNKTLHEYDDVMGHGNVGNQVIAITIENQVFTPLKDILKLNVLMFQQEAVLYNTQTRQSVTINPTTLRQTAVQFLISDGLVPKDKEMNGEEWTVAMQTIATVPQLQQQYDFTGIFTYMMQMRGADLKQFEYSPEQRQYNQALSAWQQAAAMAAQKGAEFSTPMPQPPQQQSNQGPSGKQVALAATQGSNA